MDIASTVTLRTGAKMPILALGTWKLTKNTAESIVSALELGYRMIDTSGDYGTQPDIGKGIKQSGIPREDLYLVTKVEETDDAYDATRRNLEELQLDYADLMLIHRPPEQGSGEDLWRGLIQAKNDGLTHDIGVSNYTEDQIEAIAKDSGEMPTVNQIEWSPFGHSQAMLTFCNKNNIILQAYSPLTRSEQLDNRKLKDIAERYGKTTAQLIIRWNLQLGTVPIIKANSREHQKENLQVFDFKISNEDMDRISNLNQKYSSLGSLAYTD